MLRKLLLAVVALCLWPATASASPLSWSGQTWTIFNGTGNLGQVWSPTHVVVTNGVLDEVIANRVGGGIGGHNWQTYGVFTDQYRITPGGGKYVFLLFGKQAHEEVDFAESKPLDSARTEITATLHYGTSNQEIHRRTFGDFTQWHTVGVVWRPGKLTFTIDGAVWATILSSHVPATAMHECIQTNADVGSDVPSDLYVTGATFAP